MTTTWTTRNASSTRIGGAYLTNSVGNYILTANSDRIVLIVPGGELQINTWTERPAI